MRNQGFAGRFRTSCQYSQNLINLHGIGIDDHTAKFLSQGQRQCRFSRSGRSCYHNQFIHNATLANSSGNPVKLAPMKNVLTLIASDGLNDSMVMRVQSALMDLGADTAAPVWLSSERAVDRSSWPAFL